MHQIKELNILIILVLLWTAPANAQSDTSTSNDVSTNESIDSIEFYYRKGKIFYKDGNYSSALDMFFKSLVAAEEIDDLDYQSRCSNNIAAIWYQLGDKDKAFEYFRKSFTIDSLIQDKEGMSKSMNNLAILLNEMQSYDSAIDYYNRSIEIKKELDDKDGLAASYNNAGLVYYKMGNCQKALQYFSTSIKISKSIDDNWSVANTLGNIGRCYRKMKNYTKAIVNLKLSMQLAREINAHDILLESYEYLTACYEETDQFRKAYEMQTKYYDLKDSVFSARQKELVEEIQAKYKSAEKEKENALLKEDKIRRDAALSQQRILTIAIFTALFFTIIIITLLLKNNKERKRAYGLLKHRNEEIETKSRQMAVLNEQVSKKNKELESLNQVKDKLFSIISHEIKSPLNSLTGVLTLFENKRLQPEELQKLTHELMIKLSNTTAFLNNIFQWARSQMSGIVPEKQQVSPSKICDEVIANLDMLAQNKNIMLKNTIPNNVIVNADPEMLRLIFRNLISNAIKFSFEEGNIHISVQSDNEMCQFNVQDYGTGIDDDVKDTIFNGHFFSSMGTRHEKGTGLGLMLCKEFIEKHGGKIWVESVKNNGSVFSFTLPETNCP